MDEELDDFNDDAVMAAAAQAEEEHFNQISSPSTPKTKSSSSQSSSQGSQHSASSVSKSQAEASDDAGTMDGFRTASQIYMDGPQPPAKLKAPRAVLSPSLHQRKPYSPPTLDTAGSSQHGLTSLPPLQFSPLQRTRPASSPSPSKQILSRSPLKTSTTPLICSKDPEIAALQTERFKLQQSIKQFDDKVRRLKMALRYSDPDENQKLEGLVVKWRQVAQEAALALHAKAQMEANVRLGDVLDAMQLDKRLLNYDHDSDSFL